MLPRSVLRTCVWKKSLERLISLSGSKGLFLFLCFSFSLALARSSTHILSLSLSLSLTFTSARTQTHTHTDTGEIVVDLSRVQQMQGSHGNSTNSQKSARYSIQYVE